MRQPKLRLGVSWCLLGRKVRWDGAHRRDAYVADVLGAVFDWVPVCPEVEVGLGVPREPIRLVGSAAAPRLMGERTGRDRTAAMERLAERRAREIQALGISGFVAKKDSPSCGIEGVKVHPARGGPARREGTGLFARALARRMPLLPVEEESGLADPARRESFVERVFAYARLRAALGVGVRRRDLVRFHAENELALRAHDPRALARLAAIAGASSRPAAAARSYARGFMRALRAPATRGRHAAVLREVIARLRPALGAADREELADAVAAYARGLAPLVVPITLARHHLRGHPVPSLVDQSYLRPDPRELALRNRA